MHGNAPNYPTSHDAAVYPIRPAHSRNLAVASVAQFDPEDLFAAGRTACDLGVQQLLNWATTSGRSNSAAVPGEVVDDLVDPEQFLATGFAACFWGALKLASSHSGTEMPPSSLVSAEVIPSGPARQTLSFAVALRVSLPGLDRSAAEALVRRAHEICPYSHMSRHSIDVRLAA